MATSNPAVLQCICHDENVENDDFKELTEATWTTLLRSIGVWCELVGARSEIARNFVAKHGDSEDIAIPRGAAAHNRCYAYLTDKSKQERGKVAAAKERKRKHDAGPTITDGAKDSAATIEVPAKQRKLLRSSVGVRSSSNRPNVLPEVCVICRKKKRWVKGRKGKKGETLTRCELIDGGQLTLAAKEKQDDELLHLIQGKDCVAIEVRYHQTCHREYTRFLSKPVAAGEVHAPYEESFKSFCMYAIEERVIRNKEVLRMTKLKKLFVKAVHDIQNLDASRYKTWSLKQRIKHKYPQLCFTKPSLMYKSEFVYVDTLTAEDLVEESHQSEGETTDTDGSADTTDTESDAENPTADKNSKSKKATKTSVPQMSTLRDRYNSALDLRKVIQAVPANPLPWPPSAADLSLNSAADIVPDKLYNFLAWMVGLSDDPEDDKVVKLSSGERRRVLTIAQDIIYLASKGRKPMPKHVSLGMAVRHLSGSAQLIGLLNGFGYSTSHSYVLEHDTALAQLEILRGVNALPSTLQKGIFTTVVWDNNDFGEETLSGKGSTHNTNGIAIQHEHITGNTTTQRVAPIQLKKTKQRTLPAPEKDLVPFRGQRKVTPQPFAADVYLDLKRADETLEKNLNKEAAYKLAKMPRDRLLPSWTGFNQLLTMEIPPKATIGYLPVIDASPTELDTVNTILHRSIDLADSLELPAVVVVVDQAIYAKAQTIRWQTPNFKDRIVIRLGAFHTLMTAMACVGKRFADAGLRDILVEAEIVATGSMNGVVSGHHYNRSVRAHKLVSEALERLRWESFIESIPQDKVHEYEALMSEIHSSFPHEDYLDLTEDSKFEQMLTAYHNYIDERSKTFATFAFWSSYLEMVQDILLFIRASREGDWESHLACVRRLLPWMFAYDRTNYSRYLPIYWLEMKELPKTNPFIYRELKKGNFAVQRNDQYGFSRVPCDMTIEQTANRDSKTRGGLKGFTTNKGAVNRWIRAHHERAAITRQCEEMAGRDHQKPVRPDLTKSRMEKDRQAVDDIVDTIVSMVNPFDTDPEADDFSIIHLASGVIATEDVCKDLLGAHKKGDDKMKEFCASRLQKEDVGLNETLSKMKLKTFADVGKTGRKDKGKVGAIRSDRDLMARLFILEKKRDLDLPKILSHCLGPVPAPIAHPDGSLMKTNKAKLMHYLEECPETSPSVELPKGAVWIIDGMALLQQLSPKNMPKTMGELALKIIKQMIFQARTNGSSTVHFVTDRYPEVSVKNAERKRRAATGSQRIKITRAEQPVPKQWKKFMSHSYNKEQIVEFFFKQWQCLTVEDLKGVRIFLAHGDKCHALSEGTDGVVCTEVRELSCSQEEADTRMYLHSSFSARYLPGVDIIIKSPDTDVLVIGIAVARRIRDMGSNLFFHTGKDDKERTIHLGKIEEDLGEDYTSALIGLHCFTGCDSVSSFYGKGKKKCAKLLQKHPECLPGLQALGESTEVDLVTLSALEEFVCKMYGQNDCKDVNAARYRMFTVSGRAENVMPPNHDALTKHAQRANYQAAIFKRCMEQHPDVPSPVGSGWKMEEDSNLGIDWMDMEPAEQSIMELSSCSCKKSKCKRGEADDQCCMSLGMPCTELCTCKNCTNNEQPEPSTPDVEGVEDGTNESGEAELDFAREEIFI